MQQRQELYREMGAITAQRPVDEILADLREATIPATRIFDIRQVRDLPALADRLTHTNTPDGRTIRMQPMAVDVEGARTDLPFPPKYGADTRRVLAEAGYDAQRIEAFIADGVAA